MAAREKLLMAGNVPRQLADLLHSAGYETISAATGAEAFAAARAHHVDLLLLESGAAGILAELRGSSSTDAIRVIVLSSGGASDRVHWLDLGAHDVLSPAAEPAELLARVRVQLRAKRELDALRRQASLAEESYQIAQTGFQALAVTEKMTRDAFSLDRKLKLGIGIFFLVATVMAGIFLLFFRTASTETKRAYAVIKQLQTGIASQEDLMARTAKMREEIDRSTAGSIEEQKRVLERESQRLQAQMNDAQSGEVAALRKQLADNSSRLRRIETESRVGQGIIRSYGPSVALLHVAVAFRERSSGRRLRYGGINPQGEPIQDSEGNPILELDGRGPEVRADFFGTGFLVASDGRLLTNRHVVEPWWKSEELQSLTKEGFESVIAEMTAYFPDSPAPVRVEVRKVSPVTDLAVVQGNLGGIKRAVLELDSRREAAVSGQAVVLMGYATGLDAILARAGEDVVRAIVNATNGNPRDIMNELARRGLIRPLTTQGHVGDVLADKIVYDAQTTSGGSGGPVFNQQGKVIGVNFAVLRGFGGSNFGIPIRFAEPLLKQERARKPVPTSYSFCLPPALHFKNAQHIAWRSVRHLVSCIPGRVCSVSQPALSQLGAAKGASVAFFSFR